MRKIFLAAALFLISSYTFSQFTFERISPTLVVGDSTGNNFQLKSKALLKVQTGSMQIKITRTINDLTSGWRNTGTSICNYQNCFDTSQSTIIDTYNSTNIDDTIEVYFYLFGGDPLTFYPGAGHVRLRAELVSNPSYFIEQDFRACTPTFIGIQQISSIVKEFSLAQNYPNPFNPVTKINFSIPNNEYVSLRVYDMLGREVSVLVNGQLTAGEYQADFNAATLSSGMYYYSLRAGEYVDTKKMVLVK